ncbi:MAG: prepilin-type N-terminal cleavage/methylation domain-containing protein [Candidatus Omnitrophica bacterium]|nr:prepilin-type N-terminal cleavage/methylation domain-containing protein [Candidatus Omnitrophota bacterium]
MILLTGKQKRNNILSVRPNLERAGFTLIELVLVAAIILVLTAVSTPLFKRTYEDLRLTSSAKELAAVMRFCHERAVFERRPFRLIIDETKRRYQVFSEDEGRNKFIPLKSRWGRSFRIPDDISIETEADEIDFSPNGNITAAPVYVSNKQGKTFTIVTERSTGFVRVYDSKKE